MTDFFLKHSSLGKCLFSLTIVCFCAQSLFAQTLRIYHIDVEQGDSTLIVTPSGKTLLVDSGKNGHGARIQAVMQTASVTQIDAFVATHYHEDHYGGIDDLVDAGVPVLESYDRGDKTFLPTSKKNEPTFQSYQRTVGEDAIHLTRGMSINLDPEITITCISSGGVVIGEANPTPGHEENDMSLSLLISYRGFKLFVGGDVEQPTEAKIAARDLVMSVDLYQANHHGSHSSSSLAFMANLQPTLVIISNGSVGLYKHPRAVTLKAYAAIAGPPVVLQTNKCFHPAPCANVADAFIGDREPGDDDGTILVEVDPASGSFTATYGSTTRTFTIKSPSGPVPPVTNATVVIESLLPNPVGVDEQQEEITIRNKGTQALNLQGWILRDRSGLDWHLMRPSLRASRARSAVMVRP